MLLGRIPTICLETTSYTNEFDQKRAMLHEDDVKVDEALLRAISDQVFPH